MTRFHEFRGAAQQFLDIKNRIGLAAHFVQNQKSVGLAADALEQARRSQWRPPGGLAISVRTLC